ncbi:MAG: hypothetical protein K4571_17255 [Deltaproteobacteria bacterium]
MTTCPQCGHKRTASDDRIVGAEACPRCGIFYEKWQPPPAAESAGPVPENSQEKTKGQKSVMAAALIFIVLAAFAAFILFPGSDTPPQAVAPPCKRMESTLPITPVRGMESNSYMIRASGKAEAVTAAGQIFAPDRRTPVLFKVGFLFVQDSYTKAAPDFKLQVRLSEWAGDRPGPEELWVSVPCAIPGTAEGFQADWVDFDVPHLRLDPAKQYVAWVTLSGLGNPLDAIICIPGMGPRYSSPLHGRGERNPDPSRSPYPQGRRALYRQENLKGDVSPMTHAAWEVHDSGSNLHFRMSFENCAAH